MNYRKKVLLIIPFVIFNIFSGVALAGIDAGKVYFILKVYNTWPLMNGIFFSYNEYFKNNIEVWRNLFENKFSV